MRAWIASVLIATSLTAAQAQTQAGPVKLGVLNDQSGQYADASGPASVEVVKMAIQDFGGKLLGSPIAMISADHQNKPDIGSSIARKWYDTENVNVILDLSNSAVALAVSEITREKNKIMIASSVGTSALTNEKCSPNSFQWSYNTYALARSTAKALVERGGKDWFFLTADYAFGHALEHDATSVVKQLGGKVLGAARHPFGTSDFSSFLLQAQNSGASVLGLANTGLDVSTALRQAHEFGVLGKGSTMKAAALLLQITDTHAAGLANAQGIYMSEAFYWDRDDESRKFGRRFFDKIGRMPTMVQAGLYSATMHYLKAVQAAGTTETGKVLEMIRSMPVNDFFSKNGHVREDGMHIHDYYLLRVKSPAASKAPWDYYDVISTVSGEDANIPRAESKCPLMQKS
ncbi:ABC transporter substrate-binding protein [Methylobacterium platani]|uniref:ABC transporter permease n=2 Tax=Methylobacterium platani TaxID=427683 RepID=A0A179S385_9HYPH|nr:ABC transporter permease [Methylobacterium platani JCM 14648]OAS20273.1 ABC transporter permease [Methylobacterium platani]